ncbi:MAG: helix-turn-helix domain-containing protein [Pseudomonadota bacterium]
MVLLLDMPDQSMDFEATSFLRQGSHVAFNSLPSPEIKKIVLEAIVSDVFDVPFDDLRRASRGCATVALARQVAMYLAHVHFGLSFTEVGRVFQRDRTTVSHACSVVEDRRDDASFDYVLELLERVAAAYNAPRPNLLDCAPRVAVIG